MTTNYDVFVASGCHLIVPDGSDLEIEATQMDNMPVDQFEQNILLPCITPTGNWFTHFLDGLGNLISPLQQEHSPPSPYIKGEIDTPTMTVTFDTSPSISLSVFISNQTLDTPDGTSFSLNGTNNYIALLNYDNVVIAGGGSTINFGGSGSIVTLDTASAGYAVYGGGGSVFTQNNTSVYTDAANIGFALGGGSGLTLGDNSSGIQVFGTGVAVSANNNVSFTVTGSGNQVAENGANDTATLADGGDTVFLNGPAGVVTLDTASAGYAVYGAGGSVFAQNGTSVYADATNIGFALGGGSGLTLGDNSSGIQVFGTGVAVSANNNVSFTVIGSGNQVAENGANDTATLVDGGDTVFLNGPASVVTLDTASGYNVYGTGGSVFTQNNTSLYTDATNIGFALGGGSGLTVGDNSQGIQVSGSGVAVSANNNVSFTVTGSGNQVAENGSGSTLFLSTNDQNDAVTMSANTALVTGSNVEFSVAANGNQLSLGDGSEAVLLPGDRGLHIFAGSGDAVNAQSSDSFYFTGNNEALTLGNLSGTALTGTGNIIHASGDDIYVGNGDTLEVIGNYDRVIGNNSEIKFYGNDDFTSGNDDYLLGYGSGDVYSGSGDSGNESGGSGAGDGYYGGYFGLTASGSPSSPGIEMIAQHDRDLGLNGAASAVENAGRQLQQSLSGTLPKNASDLGAASPLRWAGHEITWSFASADGSAASPFSGAIQSQYQPVIESAMNAWSLATGITLEEVPTSANPDISIGWGDFDTSSTSIVGYTSFHAIGGMILPGVTIQLENPSETPLATTLAGQLAYNNTNTDLYQAALHEIGHALGLGEDSDPSSIMYGALGAGNQGLNGTDVGGMLSRYGLDQPQAGIATPPPLLSPSAFLGS